MMALHTVTSTVVAVAFLFVLTLSAAMEQGAGSGLTLQQILALMQGPVNERFLALTTRVSLVYSVVQLVAFGLFFRHFARRERPFYPVGRLRGPDLAAIVAVGIGLAGLTAFFVMGLDALANAVPFLRRQLDAYGELAQAFTGDGSLFWTLVSTCLAVPVAEELLFRGLVLNEFRRVMPAWLAVVLQAALFALFHGNFVQSLYVFIPGLVLGLVYVLTRSLAAPIALHIVFNVLGAAVPEALGDSPAGTFVLAAEGAFILVAVLALVWLAGGRKKAAAA